MLQVKKLSVTLNHVSILRDISFTLAKGELTILLGPNGAGKSTLMKAISGWLPSPPGKIFFGREPLESFTVGQRARQIGVMPQLIPDPPYLLVQEIIMMGRIPHYQSKGRPSAVDYQKVAAMVEKAQLTDLTQRYFSTLSGGEKQRVFLAKTMVQETRVLFLDEPLASMDLHFQWETLRWLSQYCHEQQVAMLVCLHDLNLAREFGDKIIFLHQGMIIHQGSKEEVLEPAFLSQIYHLNIRTFYQGENTTLGVVN
jgi:ferric hydroxamate transport system ATP-binding protein